MGTLPHMPAYRKEVLEKLQQFLTNKINQDEIYKWALSLVVEEEYEKAAGHDPLLKEAVQALVDINHEHAGFAPTKVDLFYYKQCLEGEKDYEPLKERLEKEEKEQGKREQYRSEHKRAIYTIIRRYIILFAFVSLAVNLVTMFNPEVFELRFDRPAAEFAYREMFLHLVYAIFLICPTRVLARRTLLYRIALFVFCVGSIYYWGETAAIVLKLDLNKLMIFIFAPFTGIPTLLAIFLLKEDRNKVTGEVERLL